MKASEAIVAAAPANAGGNDPPCQQKGSVKYARATRTCAGKLVPPRIPSGHVLDCFVCPKVHSMSWASTHDD